jgi:hypothetical protein
VHFGSVEIRGARSTSVHTGPMNAATMSHLHTMPRGLPTWRADVYRSLGGHDARCGVGSTQDLLCRTYLAAHCRKTSEVLVVAGRGDTRQDAGPLHATCGDGRNPAYPSAGQPIPLRDRYLHSMVARRVRRSRPAPLRHRRGNLRRSGMEDARRVRVSGRHMGRFRHATPSVRGCVGRRVPRLRLPRAWRRSRRVLVDGRDPSLSRARGVVSELHAARGRDRRVLRPVAPFALG